MEMAVSEADRCPSWQEEALARTRYHLAWLYDKVAINPVQAEDYRSKAREVLAKNSEFATDWVVQIDSQESEFMTFADLQPTDEGRYTGKFLLAQIWKRAGISPQRYGPNEKTAITS
jgi:hypothetical protein